MLALVAYLLADQMAAALEREMGPAGQRQRRPVQQ
jgi:hypothetical protein